MHVGESVLRRPVIPAVEAAIDAAMQDGSAAADLTVVERPRVADGVRHVARSARVRGGQSREVHAVRGAGELAGRLPGYVADPVVRDRKRGL